MYSDFSEYWHTLCTESCLNEKLFSVFLLQWSRQFAYDCECMVYVLLSFIHTNAPSLKCFMFHIVHGLSGWLNWWNVFYIYNQNDCNVNSCIIFSFKCFGEIISVHDYHQEDGKKEGARGSCVVLYLTNVHTVLHC